MREAKRTVRLTIRLRPWEREKLDEAAELRGWYVSELVRRAALQEADEALTDRSDADGRREPANAEM